jgi:hypothetical protein
MSNKVYILAIIGMLSIVAFSQIGLRQSSNELRTGLASPKPLAEAGDTQDGGEAILQNNEIKNSPQKISTKDYFEKIKIYFSYLGERIKNPFSKKTSVKITPASQPASLYADPKASPY